MLRPVSARLCRSVLPCYSSPDSGDRVSCLDVFPGAGKLGEDIRKAATHRVTVRRVSSFPLQRLGRAEKEEEDEKFSTQRSVLVSRVRVEVGERKYIRERRTSKILQERNQKLF